MGIVKKIGISILLGFVIGITFYKSFLLSVIFSVVFLVFFIFNKRKDESLVNQSFKEFLNGVHSELMVGQSFKNAIISAVEFYDFVDEDFNNQVKFMKRSLILGDTEQEVFNELNNSINNYYIDKFVHSLNSSFSYSNNPVEVITKTVKTISDAIDLETEINIMIAAKKMEFHLMTLIPILLFFLLSNSQGDYMNPLYTTITGRIVMTVVLILIIISYFIGSKIIKVRVR